MFTGPNTHSQDIARLHGNTQQITLVNMLTALKEPTEKLVEETFRRLDLTLIPDRNICEMLLGCFA